ncbi:bifunctional UDP-sugar hydrolase/5'-nucleotidase [Bacillaceae bacterium]
MSNVRKVHILHTNDLHSRFGQMAKLSAGISQLKRRFLQEGAGVLVIDLGDHMDRMQLKTEATWGKVNVDVLEASGYDYVCVGNNEGLTFPKEKLQELYREASFTVVTANLHDRETGRPPHWLKPYVIEESGGIKLGILGVTAPYESFYRLLGWKVSEPQETVSSIVRSIRDKVDVVVLLSHLGLPQDEQLAESIDGIDLILGAHTHHLLPQGKRMNNTLIAQTGKFGAYLGHVEIAFDPASGAKTVTAECIDVAPFADDPEVCRIIADYRERAEETMREPVIHLREAYPVSWQEESPLGNVLAAGIRKWVNAEVAMVNSGQLLHSLQPGIVSRKDLLELCPHPINPCSLLLEGRKIRQILEESLEPEQIMRKVYGLGFRGEVLGWMCVDGMEIEYDPEARPYQRIRRIRLNGEALEEERIYKVGTVDMFTFGYLYPAFREGREIRYYLPEFIRDVLARELQDPLARSKGERKRWIRVKGK